MTTEKRGWAIITGASSGLGVEFARQLSKKGYDVVLVARRRDKLEAVARELEGVVKTMVLEADLSTVGGAAKLVAELDARSIEPSLLVNNAGVGTHGHAVSLPVEKTMAMVQLNVMTLTELSIRIGAKMAARGKGAILNVSSTASFQPTPNMAAYGATKAFVTSFSAALAEELRPKGVTVVALCPGPTKTEFMDTANVQLSIGNWAFMSADECVAIGVRALERGRSVQVAGFMNWITGILVRLFPIRLAAAVSGRIMSK